MSGRGGIAASALLLLAPAYGRDGSIAEAGRIGASGAEACHVAVLRNGFSIRYSRRETADSDVRLWLCVSTGSGYVEIAGEQIDHIEEVDAPAALAPDPLAGSEMPAAMPLATADPIRALIAGAASRHRIDADFVASVVNAESGFNPGAVSPKGAKGLMQLMPQTALSLGVHNAFDPAANVEAGTKYLRELLDQYDGNAAKALAAYNAGPQRVKQYGGIPPYAETRAFVARVIDDYRDKKRQQQPQPAGATAEK